MKKYLTINLQLFADAPVVQATTQSSLSAEMKTFYDMTLIDEAQANLVHEQFGQQKPIPKNAGKKIEFRKFASLPKALTPLTEGVTPKGSSIAVDTIEATIAQFGDYVVLTDVLELTAIDNTILETTKILGRQAGLTMDTVVRDILQSGTNVYYAPKIAEDGTKTEVTSRANLDKTSKMTVDLVKRVAAKLKASNAPKINGDYVAIIHPYVSYDIQSEKDWIEAHKYAKPENIYEGEIGKIAGVRFIESTEAKIYSGEGCPEGLAVFGCLFMGSNAYGVTTIDGGSLETIIKQKGEGGTADPLNQRSSIGWKGMKTAEILIPSYLVRVECTSDYSDTATAN